MLLYISTNLLCGYWSLPDSEGRLLVAFCQSFLLLPYYNFHLIGLDILVKAPSFDSILVLFWANSKSVCDTQQSDGTLRGIQPMFLSHRFNNNVESIVLI